MRYPLASSSSLMASQWLQLSSYHTGLRIKKKALEFIYSCDSVSVELAAHELVIWDSVCWRCM